MFGMVASGELKLTQASGAGGEEPSQKQGGGAKANAQKRVKLCDPNFGTYCIDNILARKQGAYVNKDRYSQTYTAVIG